MNVLVFDIETIPDVSGGRALHDFEGLTDEEVVKAMTALRYQASGLEMQKLHLHQIVAISVVYRSANQLKVWTLGEESASEKEIITRFFDGIERYSPTLVSWNGSGFDLPVLHYRAMRHGISCPRYWEMGSADQSFRWNNYISRYHFRHTDVMEILALYQPRAFVPLDEMASLLGFPGKMGMSGAKVWDAYRDGNLKGIRDYCETDVLNTFLVYLRFQLMRGEISQEGHEQELERLKEYLSSHSDQLHFKQFLEQWEVSSNE